MAHALVTVDQVFLQKIAHLARIPLDEPQAQQMLTEIEGLLGYLDALFLVDVTGVEPLYQPFEHALSLRKDQAEVFSGALEMVACAKEVLSESFKVPAMQIGN